MPEPIGTAKVGLVQKTKAAIEAVLTGLITSHTHPAGMGSGDMVAATYDPTNIADDAFNMDNMVDGTYVKTENNFSDADVITLGTALQSETSHADVLVTGDIGVSVEAYDADIVSDASYVHTDNNLTTALLGDIHAPGSDNQVIPVISDTAYDATSWDNNLDGASKNSIRDKIETLIDRVYPAGTLTVDYGTLDTGAVGDLAALGGTPVNISEAVGANALQVQLDFPNIVQLDGFAFYGRYAGGASHVIQVEIYNGSTWDALGQFGSTAASQWYSFNIYSPSTYIIIGTVKVRFRHLQNGIGTHDLILDYVELNHGGGGAGGTILQASSIIFNPVGSIASTNVQAAIEELDSEHPILTTGVHGAGTGEVIDRSLINFATHEFIVKDEPLTISSGELLTIGTDNTALVWCDSNKAMAMTLVEYINSQTIIRDEPYIIDYGTVAVIGYDSKASLWCDSIMAWSRDSLTFNKLVDLNIDNLYILNTNEVLDIPADSPLERHIDRKLIDSRVLWIN